MKWYIVSEEWRNGVYEFLSSSQMQGVSYKQMHGILESLINAKECKCQDCKLEEHEKEYNRQHPKEPEKKIKSQEARKTEQKNDSAPKTK